MSKRFDTFARWLMYAGAGILFVYILFMTLDVILRYIVNRPIPYDVDITQMVLVLLCAFSIVHTQTTKSHISVDLFTGRLKPRTRLALQTSMFIICAAVAGVMAWQGVLNSMTFLRNNVITYGGLPLFPVSLFYPFGTLVLCVAFLRDVVSQTIECKKTGLGPIGMLLMFFLPLAFLAVSLLCMYNVIEPVTGAVFGAFSILLLFILIFLGMPVAFSLIFTSILVMGYASSAKVGFMSVGETLFGHISSYSWIVLPLYISMSYFIMVGGLGAAAFLGAYKWLGHFRGGLAYAVVAGSTALAAVVGSGAAATVTIGLIAYPEMRRYNYADSLATGCIAAGATLGPIIPPSVPFIIYGIITQQSIGKLFIAGVVPGLLLALSFIAVIFIAVRWKPALGPPGPRISWGERARGLPVFGPIVILFLILIGGIYTGIFTVMEGGGIGAFASLVIALANRKLNWGKFKEALREAMKLVGMIFLLITGALLLSNSLGISGLSAALYEFVLDIGLAPTPLVIIILVIYVIFGIVADAAVIIMLTIPILWSMMQSMGIDLIWFGVVSAIVGGLGSISPPYAMGIFMLRAIACPDAKLSAMYKGILPFCLSTVVVVALLVAFPQLVLWLTTVMK